MNHHRQYSAEEDVYQMVETCFATALRFCEVSIIIFTIDYLLRVATANSMEAHELGVPCMQQIGRPSLELPEPGVRVYGGLCDMGHGHGELKGDHCHENTMRIPPKAALKG